MVRGLNVENILCQVPNKVFILAGKGGNFGTGTNHMKNEPEIVSDFSNPLFSISIPLF